MNNLLSKNNLKDMQIHINKAYIIIDKHIPVSYVDKVLAKLPKDTKVTKATIHNVRQKKVKASSNLEVFNAIVEVAIENKKEQQILKKLII